VIEAPALGRFPNIEDWILRRDGATAVHRFADIPIGPSVMNSIPAPEGRIALVGESPYAAVA
jgi:hypothetical protein